MRTVLITDISTDWQKLEKAAVAGIDAIHLRDKTASPREFFQFAERLRKLTLKWGISFSINERLDIALAIQADGVHLPEESLSPKIAKQFNFRVGVSVHSLAAAQHAEQEGADYLFLSDVPLQEVVGKVSIPVYAIGGVTVEKIPLLLQEGAAGVAAISAFLDVADTAAAVRAFRSAFLYHAPSGGMPKLTLMAIVTNYETAKQAIEEGADSIQFRHKGIYTEEALEEARKTGAFCKQAGCPFLINDRVDIALALKATGVHLGQTDLPIQIARRLLGPPALIGGTASTIEEALEAVVQGADYLGIGHIFPTKSKQKDYPPIGLANLQKIREKIKIPLLAIGGISTENIDSVLQTGVDGVALISAISEIKCIASRFASLKSV